MTAFRANYADLKLIKTRQTVQVIFEIPQADFDAAYEVLGGLPNPAAERWFGIAAIRSEVVPDQSNTIPDARPQPVRQPPPAGAKRNWRDIPPSQQAGMKCDDIAFISFLKDQRADDWHESAEDASECVRLICGVKSRAELNTNHKARVIWHQLNDQYEAWMRIGA